MMSHRLEAKAILGQNESYTKAIIEKTSSPQGLIRSLFSIGSKKRNLKIDSFELDFVNKKRVFEEKLSIFP